MTLGEICPKTEKEKKKKFQEEKKSTTDTLRFCGCCPAGWVGGGAWGGRNGEQELRSCLQKAAHAWCEGVEIEQCLNEGPCPSQGSPALPSSSLGHTHKLEYPLTFAQAVASFTNRRQLQEGGREGGEGSNNKSTKQFR